MKIVVFSLLALVFSSVCPKNSNIITVSGEFLYPCSSDSYILDDMILLLGPLVWFSKKNKIDYKQGCIFFDNFDLMPHVIEKKVGKLLSDSLKSFYLEKDLTSVLDKNNCKIYMIKGLPHKKIILKVKVVFEGIREVTYIKSKKAKRFSRATVPAYHAFRIDECRCND